MNKREKTIGPRGHNFGKRENVKNVGVTVKRLWSYLKKEKKGLILVCIFVLVSSLSAIFAPMFIGIAIDDYIANYDLVGLLKILIVMGVLYLCYALFNYLANYLMIGVSQRTLYNLRKDLFSNLEKLSLNYFDKNKKGDIMSRVTNDVENISQALTQTVVQTLSSTVTVIGILFVMLALNWILAITVFITIPLFLFVVSKLSTKISKYFAERQKKLGKLNGYAEENITGVKVVKAYVKEKDACNTFDKMNEDLRDVSIKAQLYSGIIFPLNGIINNLGYALLIGIGAILVIGGNATVGILASFVTYSEQFKRPISQLAQLFSTVSSALAGAERVFEVMDEEPDLVDRDKAIEIDNIKGIVEFKDVNFSYTPEKEILKDINFKVEPGEVVALVGPTGAGKSTIINLLTRFYDINDGEILVDCINIKNIKRHNLRTNIGVVLQDTYLFKGTVKDNIKYGRLDALDIEVEKAAKLAHADEFITRLPHGYNTELVEEGANLSEGQRQLISIARAILADPDILILDEATSNVDTRTEFAIQKGMNALMHGRTSFVIAHRLSTVRDANKILVIDDGRIIESGNHHELIEQKGFYYNLYMSQFE